jgi:hypothetical protein
MFLYMCFLEYSLFKEQSIEQVDTAAYESKNLQEDHEDLKQIHFVLRYRLRRVFIHSIM